MGDLSDRDVEDVLEGVQPPGRDDLADVVELTTWLHASREIEPPPAMRDDLFTQIEAGLVPYHRSSRRAPAHLRHHGPGTRRSVRQALAGSGRPLVSVAAAAVLLVGVILAVRAGGPDREPTAFVSPSAQGGSATGADEPTTTAAPTTTAPPTHATKPPGGADTGLADDVPSTTDGGTRQGPAPSDVPSDVPSTDRGSRRDDYVTPPTTDGLRRGSDDDGQAATEDPSSTRRSGQSSATSAPTDDTRQWREHLSGWDFDLSEWPWARELWDAVGDTGEPRDAVDPGGDAPDGGDDDQGRERRDTERDHGSARDGVSDDGDAGDTGDAGDNEPVDEPGDAPPG
jgi:hypothetical protein